MHYRSDPEYWQQWFPADFVTESFPGQFRNWFYSLLAMSTVLRREAPFKTLFGYALVFGEDGRQMHKSWGNAIEFDEAAERMGVDVMRWMFANARPEDNINFGWHAADEARRRLLVLWNVYSFFVTYARLADWSPSAASRPGWPSAAPGRHSTAGSWPGSPGSPTEVEEDLREYDALDAARAIDGFVEELSRPGICAARATGCGRRPIRRTAQRAFATLHAALVALSRILAPILPFLSESIYQNLIVGSRPRRGRQRPPDGLADRRAGGPATTGRCENVDGGRHARRGSRPDASRPGRDQGPPAAGPDVDRHSGRPAGGAGRRCWRWPPTKSTSSRSS